MEEDISAVARLAQEDPQKLQLHADKIRDLAFYGDDDIHHGIFKHIRFPMLEHISFDSSDLNDEKSLEPYLQPTLKDFHFFGGPISDTFLEKLQVWMHIVLYHPL
jgi:hypothetical protein